MFDNFTFENFKGKFTQILPDLIIAVLILVAGWWAANYIAKLFIKILKKKEVDPTVYPFVRAVVRLILKFAVVISALSTLGINVNSFLAAIGAAGVTAGIGLKDSVAQFASGIEILLNKPFKSGDFVEIGSNIGTVKGIHLMYTDINTIENKKVIIPNSIITSSPVINYTAEDNRRLETTFSIGYGDDIMLAKGIINNVVSENPLVIKELPILIAVKEHGDSCVTLLLRAWCKSTDYEPLLFDLKESVKYAFDKAGISIPYNQLDIHLVKESGNDDKAAH